MVVLMDLPCRVDQHPIVSYSTDGHQPNIRDLYIRIGFPIKGGMTISNTKKLDPSTYENGGGR